MKTNTSNALLAKREKVIRAKDIVGRFDYSLDTESSVICCKAGHDSRDGNRQSSHSSR